MGQSTERKSTATRLVELATERISELWHDPDNEPYATLPMSCGLLAGGHSENHPLRQRIFRAWIERLYHAETGQAPNAQAVQDALGVLSGMARFEGRKHIVHTRLARFKDRLCLDLADEHWRVVEIDADGWRLLADSPVKFRRPKGMLPLPAPVGGGDIASCGSLAGLRGYLNIDEAAWPLMLGWLVACYAPAGPYPLLILTAEQGSGKTTTARVLRSLIDPNVAPLRSEPRESRDLMIAARNGAVVMLDNLSRITPELSDDLCRLATGGGLGARQLYSDDEETLFDATRPVLITGIDDLADRGDLLDRAIIIGCPCIAEGGRRTERELWEAFELDRPALLGALLSAVSTGLRNLPQTKLPALPRMADATLWVTACESALGMASGTFAASYINNRRDANDLALDVSPIPSALYELLASAGTWEGTATDLLASLNDRADEKQQQAKAWPKSARALGNVLRRLAPNLRAVGVEVESWRQAHTGKRLIRLGRHSAVTNVTIVTQVEKSCQEHKNEGDANGDAKGDGDAKVAASSPCDGAATLTTTRTIPPTSVTSVTASRQLWQSAGVEDGNREPELGSTISISRQALGCRKEEVDPARYEPLRDALKRDGAVVPFRHPMSGALLSAASSRVAVAESLAAVAAGRSNRDGLRLLEAALEALRLEDGHEPHG